MADWAGGHRPTLPPSTPRLRRLTVAAGDLPLTITYPRRVSESHVTKPLLTPRFARAVTFAGAVHANQVRKGTDIPYLAHLMAVAALVLEAGGDEDCAIAAILHDAVEDSVDGKAMTGRIRKRFGERVSVIVTGCSDAVAVPGLPICWVWAVARARRKNAHADARSRRSRRTAPPVPTVPQGEIRSASRGARVQRVRQPGHGSQGAFRSWRVGEASQEGSNGVS